MHYVTNKYTLKTDAVVSIEMLVPIYHPTELHMHTHRHKHINK